MKLSLLAGAGTLVALTSIAALRPSASAERVWQPTTDQDLYDVSPDGELVAFIDLKTGNLMVHDLASGEDRDVTRKGTTQQNPDEADGGVFSSDGRLLAYNWLQQKPRQYSLRVIGVDGSGMRTLYSKPGVSVWPFAFTNGGVLAAFDSTNKRRWLAIVPATGGTPKFLKALEPDNSQFAIVLSPDNKYFAYTIHVPGADRKRDIVIASANDGTGVAQLRNPADDVPRRWNKDGSLIFMSDRGGSPGLWSQPMSGGKPNGAAKLLRGDLWRVSDLFVTNDGRLIYNLQAGDRDVMSAGFDAASGVALGQPVGVSGKSGERYSNAQFSPDGKYIAFMKREREGLQYNKLVIRSLSSDDVREFLPRMNVPRAPTWIPGQQALVLRGGGKDGTPDLFRLDLRTGEATELVANTDSPVAISPDGKTMYYSPFAFGDSALRRMVARDLASGRERTVYTAPAGSYIPAHSVSRDGKTLIAMSSGFAHARPGQPHGIIAIDLTTGAARSITSGIPFDSTTQSLRAMGFTNDQRSFIVMVVGRTPPKAESMWRVPLTGGSAVAIGRAPADLELNGAGTAGAWLNGDATRLAYVAGTIRNELWMLDDPALRAQIASQR
jgi:Tol biopolymer transport system component